MAEIQPAIRSYGDAKLRAAKGYQAADRLPRGIEPAETAALLVSSAGCKVETFVGKVERSCFQCEHPTLELMIFHKIPIPLSGRFHPGSEWHLPGSLQCLIIPRCFSSDEAISPFVFKG